MVDPPPIMVTSRPMKRRHRVKAPGWHKWRLGFWKGFGKAGARDCLELRQVVAGARFGFGGLSLK